MSGQAGSELMMILEQYDLGDLIGFQQDERGTVNTSFTIELHKNGERKRYFFRRYKQGVRSDELDFEHSIINHLKSNGFDIVAGVIPTRDGSTYIHRQDAVDQNGVYYAIFDYLLGEDRYTWIDPVCTPAEIASAAIVLARFHSTLSGFIPSGVRVEPKIMELLPVIDDLLDQFAMQSKGTIFDIRFMEYFDVIRKHLRRTRNSLQKSLGKRCPEVVIHCDYHPGNLKYEGDQVSGVFDLDWSKVDYRCFDVALALFYFFVSWGAGNDGALRLSDVKLFLESYQGELAGMLAPGPLTAEEKGCLPDMIAAANLYVLNWAILDYLHKDVDPDEYLVCLEHAIRTIIWLEDGEHQASLLSQLGAT